MNQFEKLQNLFITLGVHKQTATTAYELCAKREIDTEAIELAIYAMRGELERIERAFCTFTGQEAITDFEADTTQRKNE